MQDVYGHAYGDDGQQGPHPPGSHNPESRVANHTLQKQQRHDLGAQRDRFMLAKVPDVRAKPLVVDQPSIQAVRRRN